MATATKTKGKKKAAPKKKWAAKALPTTMNVKKKNPAAKIEKKAPAKKAEPKPKVSDSELEKLCKTASEAQASLKVEEGKAAKLRQDADIIIATAKAKFRDAVKPYKEACKKVGKTCEFKFKAAPVAERVRFLVEKVEKGGVRVQIKGQDKTAEIIESEDLKASVMKAAAKYCAKHLGPVEKIGHKHAGLYNRIRKVLGQMK